MVIDNEESKQAALDYHALPKPGKISIALTTPADTARDLSLAYSPGVAEPVKAIAENPDDAYKYTAKGNLVAVISDGSAILGLGDLGPLASKPVMEGKSLLFKRFAGIDSIDIEVETNDHDVDAFVDTVRRIANTFGGINLEDIRAPECFEVERRLKEVCSIPVFHDDQHGTAIVTVAGILNALEIQEKKIDTVRMVVLGAGAAAMSCTKLLILAGMKASNIIMCDSKGVIHSERTDLTMYKKDFATKETTMRTFDDAIADADIFLGLSKPKTVSQEHLRKMAPRPIVFACANPVPEIMPNLAHAARDDIIVATGRSDFPNQVNNVLGFPFIFRGTLDVRATTINDEMKVAAAHALASLAREPVPQSVRDAYEGQQMEFGRDYILPKPTDARLLGRISAAVAQAAIETGVARLPYPSHYPIESLNDM